jgi:hypothetical protein
MIRDLGRQLEETKEQMGEELEQGREQLEAIATRATEPRPLSWQRKRCPRRKLTPPYRTLSSAQKRRASPKYSIARSTRREPRMSERTRSYRAPSALWWRARSGRSKTSPAGDASP